MTPFAALGYVGMEKDAGSRREFLRVLLGGVTGASVGGVAKGMKPILADVSHQIQPSVAARALRSNPESWNAYREAHAAAKGGITIPSVASRESRKLLSKDINEFANSKAFHALGEVPRNRVAFEEIGRRASFGALLGGPIGAILSAAKATALRYKNRL